MWKILIHSTVGGFVGIALYVFQYFWIDQFLFPLEGRDHLDLTLNAPIFGAILGVLTTWNYLLNRNGRSRLAGWLSFGGGLLVATFVINVSVYGYWLNSTEQIWPASYFVLNLIPMFAFGLCYSLLLIAWGVHSLVKVRKQEANHN